MLGFILCAPCVYLCTGRKVQVKCTHVAVGLCDGLTGSDEQSINLDVLQQTDGEVKSAKLRQRNTLI